MIRRQLHHQLLGLLQTHLEAQQLQQAAPAAALSVLAAHSGNALLASVLSPPRPGLNQQQHNHQQTPFRGYAAAAAEQHERQPAPSLRAELGSGTALGTHQPGASDPAARRASLLSSSGKRFYDTVRVQPLTAAAQSGTGGYQLLLRRYPVKTPAKQLLALPTKALALAVAAEWEWLPVGKPVPHLMPLTGLACTALDQPKERSTVVDHLLKYVHTDAACIRYEPGPLEQRQRAVFDPLLAWARQELGWQLHTTHSIFGTTQDDATVAAVEAFMQGLDTWRLAAAEQLVSSTKSLVLAAALLHNRLGVRDAVAAARLEEDFQLEDWGIVEAGHDLDIADAHARIGSAAVFVRLLELQ